jgi:hypothetical protein
MLYFTAQYTISLDNSKPHTAKNIAAYLTASSSSCALPETVGDHVSPSCSIMHIPEYVFAVFYTQSSTHTIIDLLFVNLCLFFLEFYQVAKLSILSPCIT